MENASKALIIAGAILISILLITVGIMVMSSTSGIQSQMADQMSGTEKQSFNAQFTSYMGAKKTAAEVKALFEKVQVNNTTSDYKIFMTVSDNANAATTAANASTIAGLNSSYRYKILVEDKGQGATSTTPVTANSTPDGIYDTITVTKN